MKFSTIAQIKWNDPGWNHYIYKPVIKPQNKILLFFNTCFILMAAHFRFCAKYWYILFTLNSTYKLDIFIGILVTRF